MILVELDNKSTSVRMKAAKHPVSEELMVGPGENLFNFMVDRLRDFMLEHNLLGEEKEHHLGFTFSFPTVQHSLASADLATWTKGFVCSGVWLPPLLLSSSVSSSPQPSPSSSSDLAMLTKGSVSQVSRGRMSELSSRTPLPGIRT